MLELSAQGVGRLSGIQNIGSCGPSSTFCVSDEYDLSMLSSWFRLESSSSQRRMEGQKGGRNRGGRKKGRDV